MLLPRSRDPLHAGQSATLSSEQALEEALMRSLEKVGGWPVGDEQAHQSRGDARLFLGLGRAVGRAPCGRRLRASGLACAARC